MARRPLAVRVTSRSAWYTPPASVLLTEATFDTAPVVTDAAGAVHALVQIESTGVVLAAPLAGTVMALPMVVGVPQIVVHAPPTNRVQAIVSVTGVPEVVAAPAGTVDAAGTLQVLTSVEVTALQVAVPLAATVQVLPSVRAIGVETTVPAHGVAQAIVQVVGMPVVVQPVFPVQHIHALPAVRGTPEVIVPGAGVVACVVQIVGMPDVVAPVSAPPLAPFPRVRVTLLVTSAPARLLVTPSPAEALADPAPARLLRTTVPAELLVEPAPATLLE